MDISASKKIIESVQFYQNTLKYVTKMIIDFPCRLRCCDWPNLVTRLSMTFGLAIDKMQLLVSVEWGCPLDTAQIWVYVTKQWVCVAHEKY